MRCFAVRNLNRQVAALAPVVFNGLRFNASKPEGAKAEPEIDLPKCEKTVKITQLEAQLKEAQAKIAELKNDVMYQAAKTEKFRRVVDIEEFGLALLFLVFLWLLLSECTSWVYN
jgi:outer membrane murein-binding lipoprotein Lpp